MVSTGIEKPRSSTERTNDNTVDINKQIIDDTKVYNSTSPVFGLSGEQSSAQGSASGNYLSKSGDVRLGPMGNEFQIATIDGGVLSVAVSTINFVPWLIVNPESGITDDLVTITPGTGVFHNQELTIQCAVNTIILKGSDPLSNIITSNGGDLSISAGEAVKLVYSLLLFGWIVVWDSSGGGDISFPIRYKLVLIATTSGHVDLDLETVDAGHYFIFTNDLTGNVDISFTNLPPDGFAQPYRINIPMGATAFDVTFNDPKSVTPIIGGADTETQLAGDVINNGGAIFNTFTMTSTAGSGGSGVSNLSQLTIDVNKDWLAQGISNFGNLTGITGISATGAGVNITGIDTFDFFQAGQLIQNKADPDGGILYNVNDLQSHIFRAGGDEIAQFEEAAANVFRLNMFDHRIINAKDIAFDASATFAGSGAVPTIGYDTTGADLFYNAPDNAKHVWTTNNNELMGLTESQLTFAQGLKIQANPNTTNPGLSVGQFAGNPSSLTNGDIWYNSSDGSFKFRQNGATVGLGGTGSQTPILQDVDYDGFDIQDLSNIEFRQTTGTPSNTTPAIYRDTTFMFFNVPTGNEFIFETGGSQRFVVGSSVILCQANVDIDGNELILDSGQETKITATDTFLSFEINSISQALEFQITDGAGSIHWPVSGFGHAIKASTTSLNFNLGAVTDNFNIIWATDTSKQMIFTPNHIDTRNDSNLFLFESIFNPETPADDDVFALYQWNFKNSVGTIEPYAQMKMTCTDVSNGTEDADIEFSVMQSGIFTPMLLIDANLNEIQFSSGADLDLQGGNLENIGTFTINGGAPSVTGSRGGNAALTSLLTVLDNEGLITDNTTA